MMTNRKDLDSTGIIAQMMGYLISMRRVMIFLATTPNLTQNPNYLYHLIHQRRNQPRSNGNIKLMESGAGAGEQVFNQQKSGSHAMLVDFRSRRLSVIILRPYLSEPKICQLGLLKKSYHRSQD